MHSGCVTTEGDDLYFEVRGHGPPLLLIPGGGGDGNSYSAIAQRLSDGFKVIMYDRRAGGRSTMNYPDHFDIAQQSRDAVTVLQAVGETSAFVFGNSSGAVIALDVATTYPNAVIAIVAHEPPLARLHPNSVKWQSFFQDVHSLWHRFGPAVAMLKFFFGVGFDFSFIAAYRAFKAQRKFRARSAHAYLNRRKVIDFFLGQELLPVTNYMPSLNTLQRMKDKVVMAAGRNSLANQRFYAQVAPLLAQQIGCETVLFPGHHGSFVDMPDEWASCLSDTLKKRIAG
jgi:pimeloyl-ACP methyl ester carboxylesterase